MKATLEQVVDMLEQEIANLKMINENFALDYHEQTHISVYEEILEFINNGEIMFYHIDENGKVIRKKNFYDELLEKREVKPIEEEPEEE